MNAHAVTSNSEKSGVHELFSSLNRGIQSKNIDAVMRFFDPTNFDLQRQMHNTLSNAIQGEHAFILRYEPTLIQITGKSATVCAYKKYRFNYNERTHGSDDWKTFYLQKENNQWLIKNLERRVYAKPDFTALTVYLEPSKKIMRGEANITFSILKEGETSLLACLNRGLEIISVTDSDGENVSYSRVGNQIQIQWHKPFHRGEQHEIQFKFEGTLFNESKEKHFSQVNIGSEGSFASWVTHWYPNLDTGISKSIGRVVFHVPKNMDVVCNGKRQEAFQLGTKKKCIFNITNPMNYTFAAAKYTHKIKTVNGIQVGAFFLSNNPQKTELYLEKSAELISFLKTIYGGYPFDSYYIVEIPSKVTGNLGGSSEQGMNLFPDRMLPSSFFNLPLFAHEIGHSWWGNLVNGSGTALLNEGLAQLTSILAVEHFMGETTMRRYLKYGFPYYNQSAVLYFSLLADDDEFDVPLAVPNKQKQSIIHLLSDVKGHFAFNIIRDRLGNEAFLNGLQNAIDKYSGKSMDLKDLRLELEKITGESLSDVFDQWFYRSGVPDLKLNYNVTAKHDGYEINTKITQTEKYDLNVEILVLGTEKQTFLKSVQIKNLENQVNFQLPFEPDKVLLDPNYKILRWTPQFRDLNKLQPFLSRQILKSQSVDDLYPKIDQYLEKYPSDLLIHFYLAELYMKNGEMETAIHAHENIIRKKAIQPVYDDYKTMAYLNLGMIYDVKGNRSRALDNYRMVLDRPALGDSQEKAEKFIEKPYKN